MSQITNLELSADGSGAVMTLTGNTGGAVSPDGAGNINVLGDGTIAITTGSPGTSTLTISLENGQDGQLLIGSTAGSLAFATISSADASVTITNGSNSIDLAVDPATIGAVDGIIPDSGTSPVVPDASGDITYTGGTTGLTFVGSLNTVTLDGTLIVANGGTGATTLTDGGILLGSGTGPVTVTAQPTNGQLLIGSTGVDPALATLASADSSVTITNGAGTIDLAVNAAASGAVDGLIPDSGTSPVTPNASGDITVAGGTLISTVGTLNTVTFNLDNGTNGQLIIGSTAGSPAYANLASADSSVTITNGSNSIDLSVDAAASGAVVDFLPDSGTSPVVPDGTGSVTITGGTTGLTFVGGTNSLTQSGTLIVANGGTGATSLTDGGIVLGSGTAPVTVTAQPTNGQLLIGSNSSDPVLATLASADGSVTITNGAGSIDLAVNAAASGAVTTITGDTGGALSPTAGNITFTGGSTGLSFAGATSTETLGGTLVVGNGGTGNTTFTAYSVITAGTTATGAFQNVSGVGTSGQVLTSNGAAALPSWQDASGGSLSITSIDNTDSPYTVLAADQFIAANVTSGTITVNLPNTTDTGRVIYIKDSAGNAAANNITLTTPGGTVTIDGSTSFAMNTNYQSVSVVFDGANYLIF